MSEQLPADGSHRKESIFFDEQLPELQRLIDDGQPDSRLLNLDYTDSFGETMTVTVEPYGGHETGHRGYLLATRKLVDEAQMRDLPNQQHRYHYEQLCRRAATEDVAAQKLLAVVNQNKVALGDFSLHRYDVAGYVIDPSDRSVRQAQQQEVYLGGVMISQAEPIGQSPEAFRPLELQRQAALQSIAAVALHSPETRHNYARYSDALAHLIDEQLTDQRVHVIRYAGSALHHESDELNLSEMIKLSRRRFDGSDKDSYEAVIFTAPRDGYLPSNEDPLFTTRYQMEPGSSGGYVVTVDTIDGETTQPTEPQQASLAQMQQLHQTLGRFNERNRT